MRRLAAMEITIYILSGACGAVASAISYVLYTFSEGDVVNFKSVLGFFIVGIILGIFPVYKLKKRVHLNSVSKRAIFYLELNLFIGIIFGYLAGLLGSWLLFLPFSLLFGHPEATTAGWSPFIGYLFFFVAGILFISSLLFFPLWFAAKFEHCGK